MPDIRIVIRLLTVLFVAILGFSPAAPLAQSAPATGRGELLVYFGTYTGEKSTSRACTSLARSGQRDGDDA